jgi:hypothetical protein
LERKASVPGSSRRNTFQQPRRNIDSLNARTLALDWRSAALAGLAAGTVATAAEIVLWWVVSQPLPAILYRDARFAAAIVMGRAVLPPPAAFDVSILLVATMVHFALSLAYGVTLSAMISRLGTRASLLAGAGAGLALYAVNMYGFTFVFPWFAAVRDWIAVAAHVVFGVVVAGTYKLVHGRHPRSPKV